MAFLLFAKLQFFMFLCKSFQKRFKSYKCMKLHNFLLSLSLLFCLSLALPAQVRAQTSSFEILAKGASKDKYVAIKGEEIKPDEKYAYMFSNLSRYRVLVKSKDASTKVLIKILDKEQKEVATNFFKKKYHSEMNFKCGKTGMYYVVFQEVK
jgi:hypothetical protein